jgi:hypothetical protein
MMIDMKKLRYMRSGGFTMIELMLSIALVLLLIIGINYVFKATADAVGAGETIGTMSRDTQAAQPMIFDDFRNIAKNPPCFIIASQIVTQFLNADDAATSTSPYQIVSDNSATPITISSSGGVSPALYNYRNHRCDMIRFPAHGSYARRSANDAELTSPETGDDAFITIAHAQLPMVNEPGVFVPPGPNAILNGSPVIYSNGNPPTSPLATQLVGPYASDWVLARSVILMKDPNAITYPNAPTYPLAAPAGTDVYYPAQLLGSQPAAPNGYYSSGVGPNITPLGYFSPDSSGTVTNYNQYSRYDLAGITIEQFRRQIQDCLIQFRNLQYTNATIPPPSLPSYLWWNPLIYDMYATLAGQAIPLVLETGNPVGGAGTIIPYPYYAISGTNPNAPAVPVYTFGPTPNAINANAEMPNLARPCCNPLIQTPLTSAELAQMSPYFLQHCSQFIVEYAGDYIQQDNNAPKTATNPTGDVNAGAMTGVGPDGQIDYVLDANGNKRIRWYGMPRSFYNGPNPAVANNAGAIIRGFDPAGDPTTLKVTANGQNAVDLSQFVDVIPLRDYWWMYTAVVAGKAPGGNAQTPPWEVDVDFDPAKDYANNPSSNSTYISNAFQLNTTHFPQRNARYACAWYDDMPAMIRILIKVDDPNNKVKDGPWYEYVFKLK